MKNTLMVLQKQYADVGDRITVRSNRKALAAFAGQSGIVVAVFPAPRGSCVIRLDKTPGRPEIFVYQTEITAPIGQ
ncbi:MAG TPA: hypothetical protein VFS21_21700 [Roseiflexaceae bacterium]|nr:hypothetical protein [Roseiflexaceae bacterium]